MEQTGSLLLTRGDVVSLLGIAECMDAVENAFKMFAEGKASPPKLLGLHTNGGAFHIKAGTLGLDREFFVAKLNANFPGNPKQFGLPTIQGIVVVCDAIDGRLLALMDSIEITILRTGAATGIAAKYLSMPNASVVTICGCGNQGRISLQALMQVRKIEQVFVFDIDPAQVERFQQAFSGMAEIIAISEKDLSAALRISHVVITCTTSKKPFIQLKDVSAGTFLAAVGADSEEKQELFPDLIASSKIVVDLADQCASIGELHHAIKDGLIATSGIHAELGDVIAGKKAGRELDEEIIVFDSTGMALQDVATAALVYEKALSGNIGNMLNFSSLDLHQIYSCKKIVSNEMDYERKTKD